MMSMLSIASWNVHGLTKDLKKEQLVMDAKRYGFDFVALQETKCQDYAEIDLMNYSLILFEQLPQGFYHHGLGFLISPQLRKSVVDWRRVSNRVAFINFRLTSKNGTLTYFRLINAYGPTMKNVEDADTVEGLNRAQTREIEGCFYGPFHTLFSAVATDSTVCPN